jgi:xylan 1,4-beta-xylosidase
MPNLAINDVRIFGKGTGTVPDTPKNLSAIRDTDARNALVKWEKVPGAVGYNIRWGNAATKLNQTYQIWGD